MLENGEFAIAVPQISKLFSFPIKHASRDLKDRLGNDFPFPKVTTSLNSKAVNILSLVQFEKLIRQLDREGNELARELVDDLVGLSLVQLFSDSFGIKFEKEDREKWIKARSEGKLTRRTLTDAIQAWIEANNPSDNYRKWIYANCTDQINLAIFGAKASKIRAKLDIKQIRDACNAKQIKELDLIEELICREIEEGGLEPLEATKFVIQTQRVRSLPLV